jgi:hypothetical protein
MTLTEQDYLDDCIKLLNDVLDGTKLSFTEGNVETLVEKINGEWKVIAVKSSWTVGEVIPVAVLCKQYPIEVIR